MICGMYRRMTALQAGGELAGWRQRWLARHLADCPACREQLAELILLRANLADFRLEPVDPALLDGLSSGIRERLRQERLSLFPPPGHRPGSWRARHRRWLLAAAALLLLLGPGYWMWQYRSGTGPLHSTVRVPVSRRAPQTSGKLAAAPGSARPAAGAATPAPPPEATVPAEPRLFIMVRHRLLPAGPAGSADAARLARDAVAADSFRRVLQEAAAPWPEPTREEASAIKIYWDLDNTHNNKEKTLWEPNPSSAWH